MCVALAVSHPHGDESQILMDATPLQLSRLVRDCVRCGRRAGRELECYIAGLATPKLCGCVDVARVAAWTGFFPVVGTTRRRSAGTALASPATSSAARCGFEGELHGMFDFDVVERTIGRSLQQTWKMHEQWVVSERDRLRRRRIYEELQRLIGMISERRSHPALRRR